MKIIFLTVVITCCAWGANAQIAPDLLQNKLSDLKLAPLKIDTGPVKLIVPKYSLGNGLLHMPTANILTGDQIVYSRMPVARLHSDDHMPVARAHVGMGEANVLHIKVADPLKDPTAKNDK